MRRYIIAGGIALSLLFAIVASRTVMADNNVPGSFFAVATLLAAPFYRPRAVSIVAAIAIAAYVMTCTLLTDVPSLVWLFGVLGLALVGVLATKVAHQREITERHAAAATRERAQMERFLNMITHEFGNSLTSVFGQLQLVQRRLRATMGEREQKSFRAMHDGIVRLNRLIDDLRDVQSVRRGVFTIEPCGVDLASAVRSAAADAAIGSAHRLRCDLPERLDVPGDSMRLYQVVHNLVSNALKYSPEDREVSVTLLQRGTSAVIEVTDQGQGINEADQLRLFEPFTRLNSGESSGGMGLGLFVTKGIVESHGGRISLMSTVGHGTTFTVVLPTTAGIGRSSTARMRR